MSRDFNGSSDFARVASAAITGYPFTFFIQGNCDAASTSQSMLTVGDGASNANWDGFRLGTDASNHLVGISSVGGTSVTAATSTTYSTGTWFDGIFTGGSATDRAIYLNNGGVGTNTTSSTPSGISETTIGRRASSTTQQFFDGRLAWAAMWNVVLTADERAALHAGVPPWRVRPLALVGCWPLWGIHSPEIDLTSGARSMTLTGTSASASNPPVALRLRRHTPIAPVIGTNTQYDQPLSASVGMTPALVRQAGKPLAASSALVAALVRSIGKPLAASSPVTAALTASKTTALQLAAVAAAVAAMSRQTGKPLAASAGSSAALMRQTGKPLAASAGTTPALVRSTGKPLAAVSPVAAALATSRTTLATLAVSVGAAAALTRSMARALAAALPVTAAVTRQVGKILAAERKNWIRNNSMQGAATGTPGTVPTNWGIGTVAGVTRTIVAVGTIDGLDYIDVRLQGSAAGSGEMEIRAEPHLATAASPGQTWTGSMWSQIIAGSTDFGTTSTELIALKGAVVEINRTQINQGADKTDFLRRTVTHTMPADTEAVTYRFRVAWTGAQTIDYTARIAMPQLELGSNASAVIRTTGAAVTESSFGALPALVRQTGKPLAASAGTVAALTRQTGKPLSASIAIAAAMTRAMAKTLAAAVPLTPALLRSTARSLAASVSLAASLDTAKVKLLELAAAIGAAAALVRSTTKDLAASLGTAPALTRAIGKPLAAPVALVGASRRDMARALAASVGAAAALTRSTARSLPAAIGVAGALTKQVGKALAAAVGFALRLKILPPALSHLPRSGVSRSPGEDRRPGMPDASRPGDGDARRPGDSSSRRPDGASPDRRPRR